jgi:hypothetical protein
MCPWLWLCPSTVSSFRLEGALFRPRLGLWYSKSASWLYCSSLLYLFGSFWAREPVNHSVGSAASLLYFLDTPSSLVLFSLWRLAAPASFSLEGSPYFLILSLVPFYCIMLPMGVTWWSVEADDSWIPFPLARLGLEIRSSLFLLWVRVFSWLLVFWF